MWDENSGAKKRHGQQSGHNLPQKKPKAGKAKNHFKRFYNGYKRILKP